MKGVADHSLRADDVAEDISNLYPDDDVLLAADNAIFLSGSAHRWRNIALMAPGKKAGRFQSRSRCDDDFIKAHLTRKRRRMTNLRSSSANGPI